MSGTSSEDANRSQMEILKTILEEFRSIGQAITALAERQARTETNLTNLANQMDLFSQLDGRVDSLDRRIAVIETTHDTEGRSEESTMNARRFIQGALISAAIAVFGTLLAFTVSHLKWH